MKTETNKIQVLRNLISKLSPSPYSNCIAGNSKIKFIPDFKGGNYQIWAGDMNPYFEGNFDEVKERIEQEIELELHGNWGER